MSGYHPEEFHESIVNRSAQRESARQWFYEAVNCPDSPAYKMYASYCFSFADDILQWEKNLYRDDEKEFRIRALHRYTEELLRLYEFSAAGELRKRLKTLGVPFFWRWRPFFFWRVPAGIAVGSAAILSSSGLVEVITNLRAELPCAVVFPASILLMMSVILFFEYVSAPVPLARASAMLWRRWLWVSAYAAGYGAVAGFLHYGMSAWLSRACAPKSCSPADPTYVMLFASFSVVLGYLVNLFWRERPVSGP